jgi:hypothetical protein
MKGALDTDRVTLDNLYDLSSDRNCMGSNKSSVATGSRTKFRYISKMIAISIVVTIALSAALHNLKAY